MSGKNQKREKSALGLRLELALAIAGMSQNELARRLNIRQSTVNALIWGESAGSKHIVEMAEVLGQDPLWLQKGAGEVRREVVHKNVTNVTGKTVRQVENWITVKVVGAVQAGVWARALEWSDDDQREVQVSLHPQYQGLPAIGLELIGPSMDLVYPHKTVLILVSYIDLGVQPKHEDHVFVQHWKDDLVDATVKEFRIDDDGVKRLWPRSKHPDFQAPLKLTKPPKGEEIRITHKVVQAIINRP